MPITTKSRRTAVEAFARSGLIVPGRLANDVKLTGFEDPTTKSLLLANHLLRKANMATLSPLLPLLLNLKGTPYTLKDHFPFEPFFRTRVPGSTLLKTGRQVSKSTSLASRGIVMSNCIPHFSTLYLTPLYEQVRRFSQNYIRPFIETSPLNALFMGKGTMNSVLQRTFMNRSQLLFSFAFVDAERTRGISADKVAIDESILYDTWVDTPRGDVKVQHLIPGDLVYASDQNGKIVERKVLDNQHHGTQECYRITLSNGSVLGLTSDSFVATTIGWRRVSTMVQDLVDAAASADAVGDDAGGRVNDNHQDRERQPDLSKLPRLGSKRLQHREVPGIARVRKQSTREEDERRLRRLQQSLVNQTLSRIAPYRVLVSSQGQEKSHTDLARSDDLRGDSLVAHGRRHPAEQRHAIQHTGVYEAGVYPPGFLAHAYGVSGVGQARPEPAQPGLQVPLGVVVGSAEASPRIQEADIVGVEAIGPRPVCDIEVEGCHNFFADGVLVANCQNMDKDLLPIIMEVMSASKFGIKEYAGTPLSLENTIEGLWQDSSMAEWVIKCERMGCGYYNVPCLSHDLDNMIGPLRRDISDDKPACICAKCGKPLNPRRGMWIHAFPERRWRFSGYHVPQIVMPMHYASYDKWSTLIGKREGKGNTQTHQFYNEVCGESYDTGSRMVTMTDLQQAADLGWDSTIESATPHIHNYRYRVLAVDWGGGGQEGVSFTALAVLGILPDGKIHCLWGHRSLTPHDHIREAQLCLHIMAKFQCHVLAHDYNGAGALRETLIHHAGVPISKIVPIQYVRAASSSVMTFKPATPQHPRDHYSVDKSRSLLLTCNHIKQKWLRFYNYDYKDADDQGLLHDFLALVEEKTDSRTGKDIYTIIRDPHRSDDFAQAVNMGCCTLWHMTGQWPNIAEMTKFEVSQELMDIIAPADEVAWTDI